MMEIIKKKRLNHKAGMSQPDTRLDESIAQRFEELYELERDCSTGPLMSAEDKMRIIQEYLAPDYWNKLAVKAELKKQELIAEIAATSDVQKRRELSQKLDVLKERQLQDNAFLLGDTRAY